MIDLISRKDAIGLEYIVKNINGVDYVMLSEVQMKLRKMPSAQPEIIHCKECKYAHMTYDGDCKYCDVWFPDESKYVGGDYYCASAERKTDE